MPLDKVCRPPVCHIPLHSLLWYTWFSSLEARKPPPESRPGDASGWSRKTGCLIRTFQGPRTLLSHSAILQSCPRSTSLPRHWLSMFQMGMRGRLSGKMALVSWPLSPSTLIWRCLSCQSPISPWALGNCNLHLLKDPEGSGFYQVLVAHELHPASESPGVGWPGSIPRVSDSLGLGWGLVIWYFDMFPDDAPSSLIPDGKNMLWEPLFYTFGNLFTFLSPHQ